MGGCSVCSFVLRHPAGTALVLVGRLLSCGSIMFMTPGEGGCVVFRGVENPVALKSMFFSLVKKIKRMRLEELLRELERECGIGRIPEDGCAALRRRYEEGLKKLEGM